MKLQHVLFKNNCDHSSFVGNNHSDYMRAEANGENVQHRVAARMTESLGKY